MGARMSSGLGLLRKVQTHAVTARAAPSWRIPTERGADSSGGTERGAFRVEGIRSGMRSGSGGGCQCAERISIRVAVEPSPLLAATERASGGWIRCG